LAIVFCRLRALFEELHYMAAFVAFVFKDRHLLISFSIITAFLHTLQQFYNVRVLDSVIYLCSVPSACQDLFIAHHVEVLACDGLFYVECRKDIPDTHLAPP
jgi:hypothetical protein